MYLPNQDWKDGEGDVLFCSVPSLLQRPHQSPISNSLSFSDLFVPSVGEILVERGEDEFSLKKVILQEKQAGCKTQCLCHDVVLAVPAWTLN